MERIITKSFARLMGRGVHRGFITYEELNKSLGKRNLSQENLAQAFIHILDDKIVLEIRCSTGIITNYFADYFLKIDGIDIDKKEIEYANLNNKKTNVLFQAVPIEEFESNKNYDVIVCSHIYEHVPDSRVLLDNIYRLLKPGGVCYFAARNKFQPMEPHYNLLFLSYLPKSISNLI